MRPGDIVGVSSSAAAKSASGSLTRMLPGVTGRRSAPGRRRLLRVRGYDSESVHLEVESRHARLVIPLGETAAVKAGKHKPPSCEHGEWTFAGSDTKRGASKWRCPTGECSPKSVWVKASRLHPLIPRETEKFKTLYHQRGAVAGSAGSSTNGTAARCACGELSASGCTWT